MQLFVHLAQLPLPVHLLSSCRCNLPFPYSLLSTYSNLCPSPRASRSLALSYDPFMITDPLLQVSSSNCVLIYFFSLFFLKLLLRLITLKCN
ncbi:hypothetical protein V8E52_004477 [Russula decolorans]